MAPPHVGLLVQLFYFLSSLWVPAQAETCSLAGNTFNDMDLETYFCARPLHKAIAFSADCSVYGIATDRASQEDADNDAFGFCGGTAIGCQVVYNSTNVCQAPKYEVVGAGFCRDSTCNNRTSCSHPWIANMSCATRDECMQSCGGVCAGFAWALDPPASTEGCRGSGRSRCIVYNGTEVVTTTQTGNEKYTCYRPTAAPAGFDWLYQGCVSGHNISLYTGHTLDDCAVACTQTPACKSFVYGVFHGGSGVYNTGDCQLKSSADANECDGAYHNLDLYIKRGLPTAPQWLSDTAGWTATAKSTADPDSSHTFHPANVLDGHPQTYWSSSGVTVGSNHSEVSMPQWVKIGLPSTHCISGVRFGGGWHPVKQWRFETESGLVVDEGLNTDSSMKQYLGVQRCSTSFTFNMLTASDSRALVMLSRLELYGFQASCPDGYVFTTAALDGEGKMWTYELGSIDGCAKVCTTRAHCTSFEYSRSLDRCGTYTSGASNIHGSQRDGWITCYKAASDPLETSVSPSNLYTGFHVALLPGIKLWGNREYTLDGPLPVDMHGAVSYRLSNHTHGYQGESLTFNTTSLATMFVCFEPGPRDCGYSLSLPVVGFTRMSASLSWETVATECYSRPIGRSVSLPQITTAACVQIVALKETEETPAPTTPAPTPAPTTPAPTAAPTTSAPTTPMPTMSPTIAPTQPTLVPTPLPTTFVQVLPRCMGNVAYDAGPFLCDDGDAQRALEAAQSNGSWVNGTQNYSAATWSCYVDRQMCQVRSPDCRGAVALYDDLCAPMLTRGPCEEQAACDWREPTRQIEWSCQADQREVDIGCRGTRGPQACMSKIGCFWRLDVGFRNFCPEGLYAPCRGHEECNAIQSQSQCASQIACTWHGDEPCKCAPTHFGPKCENNVSLWQPRGGACLKGAGFANPTQCHGITYGAAFAESAEVCIGNDYCQSWHRMKRGLEVVVVAAIADITVDFIAALGSCAYVFTTQKIAYVKAKAKEGPSAAADAKVPYALAALHDVMAVVLAMCFIVDVLSQGMVWSIVSGLGDAVEDLVDSYCFSQGSGYEAVVELRDKWKDVRRNSGIMVALAILGVMCDFGQKLAQHCRPGGFDLPSLGVAALAFVEIAFSVYDYVLNTQELVEGIEAIESAVLGKRALEKGYVCVQLHAEVVAEPSGIAQPIQQVAGACLVGFAILVTMLSVCACCSRRWASKRKRRGRV